jgi:hypothetical protein
MPIPNSMSHRSMVRPYSTFGVRYGPERPHSGKGSMPKLKRHQREYLFEVAPLAFARGQ